ncbi:hypothetical protein [Paenibacillus rigui]|uniref:Uncharacterized protein n=1 Tax=Paenibacillus rigui TaxID=554312 RepID=A0A229UV67_9BACL|nr:hypothetical protein [Paenibacillus rigui]OXM87284.1 hypothetical protein CF651_06505 [Paenibacillus rigui]
MNPSHGSNASWQTEATFRALVEAIVPNMPDDGGVQAAGAVDTDIHQYMIWELNHSLSLFMGFYLANIPLACATAQMLNAGASELLASGNAQPAFSFAPGGECPFVSLSPFDRIRVLFMLEQLQVDLGRLPPPYKDDGGFVRFIVDYLNRGTMFGFYSEWSAYGSTRLRTPTERRLEYFPISWRQVGYPGVVKGYRAFGGFLLTIKRNGGGSRDG